MVRVIAVVQNESVPRDRRVWLEAKCLAESGFNVTVISPSGDDRDTEATTSIDGIDILRYKPRTSDGSARGHLVEYLSSAWSIARLLWRLRNDADVVHVANPPDYLLLLAAPLKVLKGTKLVFDHHDLFPELFEARFGRRGLGRWIALKLELSSYKLADAVVCTNESYRRLAIERGGVDEARTTVVRNAPNATVFTRGEPDESLKRGRAHLAVYVGVMGPQDGLEEAIRAMASYKHRLNRTDLHAAFVGDGDAVADGRQLARDLDVDDMVEFVGWQETEAVVRYLTTAAIGIASDPPNALNDHSTMIKVVEYLTMGVPTVSFDLPESVVTAGDMAVFVPGGDIDGFADAMAALIDDDDRRLALQTGGQERAREHLSWDASTEALRECYRLLLARPLPLDPALNM